MDEHDLYNMYCEPYLIQTSLHSRQDFNNIFKFRCNEKKFLNFEMPPKRVIYQKLSFFYFINIPVLYIGKVHIKLTVQMHCI